MFELDRLTRNKKTKELEWQRYYFCNDIDIIYRVIEISNLESAINSEEITSYRILIDDRVFAFIPANDEYRLNFMREHYNTNEKCRPRYTSDEYNAYDLGKEKIKTKKKGRK